MTIVHIVQYYDVPGGLKTHVDILSNELSKQNVRNIIICVQSTRATGWDIENKNVLWINRHAIEKYLEKYNYIELKTLEISEHLENTKINIVHAHSTHGYEIGICLANILRCPSVMTLHGAYIFYPHSLCLTCDKKDDNLLCDECKHKAHDEYSYAKFKFLQHRTVIKSVDKIIALNSYAYNYCLRKYDDQKSKITKINHGVNIPTNAINKNLVFTILWVGAERKEKKFSTAIEAFEKLIDLGFEIRLTVIGLSEKYFKDNTSHLNQNVSSRIINRGEVSYNELSNFYLSSHLLWLTSEWESVSYVLLETMAHGLPSVSCMNLDNTDFLIHNYNTFLVPMSKADLFVAATINLMNNLKLLNFISTNAVEYVKKHHSTESFSKNTLNVYLSAEREYY